MMDISQFHCSICTVGRGRWRSTALFDQSRSDRVWRYQIRLQNRFCKCLHIASFLHMFVRLGERFYAPRCILLTAAKCIAVSTFLILCFLCHSILMRIHILKIRCSPKSFTWMRVGTRHQNPVKSNGNLERYASV